MFYFIYRIPMNVVPLIIVAAVIIWGLLMRVISGKYDKAAGLINRVMLFVSVSGIIYITLARSGTHEREVYLMPFHILSEAAGETDFYRSMLMNLFLFVPFGLCAPFSLPEDMKTGKRLLTAFAAAVALSVFIELLQYLFYMGRCETDDVLCNAAGALAGFAAYIIYKLKDRK